MALLASVLWCRLDRPGHDACWLASEGSGFVLRGAAVFAEGGEPANLDYIIICDDDWRTLRGSVTGRIGGKSVNHLIERDESGWTLDGEPMPALAGAVDLDLNFTPATNLLQLRRIALEEGSDASFPVAWLEIEAGRLMKLPQTYRRIDASHYDYESPDHGYRAVLEMLPNGFVKTYPGLWQAEADQAQ